MTGSFLNGVSEIISSDSLTCFFSRGWVLGHLQIQYNEEGLQEWNREWPHAPDGCWVFWKCSIPDVSQICICVLILTVVDPQQSWRSDRRPLWRPRAAAGRTERHFCWGGIRQPHLRSGDLTWFNPGQRTCLYNDIWGCKMLTNLRRLSKCVSARLLRYTGKYWYTGIWLKYRYRDFWK